MNNPRTTTDDLKTYIKEGFGEEAASLELDCLALATCYNKQNTEHAEHAKLAKKAIKKHASDACQAAYSVLSRRNYFPKEKIDRYGETNYVFSTLEKYFDDDLAALTELEGFDHLGYFGRLAALHHQVARHLLERADITLFEEYFLQGHRSDTLTEEHLIETNGRYHSERVYKYSAPQLEALARNPRFTELELWFDGDTWSLPEDLSAWSKVESLALKGDGFSEITQAQLDSIASLPALRELRLALDLKSLPEDWSGLSELTHLNLAANELTSLPESLSELTNLVDLDLTSNNFVDFPEAITSMTALRELGLGRNWNLTNIPDGIGDLKELECLYVWGTSVSSCSPRLGELTNLRELHVSGHKNTDTLFEVLGKLQGLKSLSLKDLEHLTELPDSIAQLTGLETLSISRFEKLESWFDGLGKLTNLVELRLEHISFKDKDPTKLFEGLDKLENLEILSFNWSELRGKFPEQALACTKLKELDLGSASVGPPPEDIGRLENLEVLDMTGVSIKKYPPSLFTLEKLKKLDLSGGSLAPLPDAIRGLKSLESLDIGWSHVERLPDAIVELENLRELRVSRNESFNEFPEGFEKLTNLQNVWCVDCDRFRLLPVVRELKKKMKWCKFVVNG